MGDTKARTAREQPAPNAVLEIVRGLAQGSCHEVGSQGVTIGRGRGCDVALRDPSLSRRHAHLEWRGDSFWIEDLASTHGVFVGAERVSSAAVPIGSLLQLGAVVMRLVEVGAEDTTAGLGPSPLMFLPGAAAVAAVDRLDFAVLLVDRLHVLSCNHAARTLLDEADGLALQGQWLRATDPAAHRQLQRLLGGEADGAAAGLVLPRRPPRRPLAGLVTPLGPATTAVPLGASLLYVTDPERREGVPAELVERLYDLTQAEARIAHLVSRGLDAAGVARAAGVSVATVRTHLKRIFEKTATHRQSELVHLLGGLAPLRSA